MHPKIKLIEGDITKLQVDAIVNAANESLLGGGGVDGAIHRAAGGELYDECVKLNGCPTGEAKISKGYKLPAKYVIHTVGPVSDGGNFGEPELLANCYRNSLAIALKHNLKTIAFPAISCGVYGYPLKDACRIAGREVTTFLHKHSEIEQVIFVAFGKDVKAAYEKALEDN